MGGPWFALRGAHELCIHREGDLLQLKRWSRSENCAKIWATLRFITWEGVYTLSSMSRRPLPVQQLTAFYLELILQYCTFLALKARNSLTVQLGAQEYTLRGERKLFQA